MRNALSVCLVGTGTIYFLSLVGCGSDDQPYPDQPPAPHRADAQVLQVQTKPMPKTYVSVNVETYKPTIRQDDEDKRDDKDEDEKERDEKRHGIARYRTDSHGSFQD